MVNKMADSRARKSFDSMKVAELTVELQKRGLSKSGKKSDLIKRLKKAIEDEKLLADTETEDTSDPIIVSTDEGLLSAGTEDEAQPDSTSVEKTLVTSSTEIAQKTSDGLDLDTLEVHLVDNELHDLVHEDEKNVDGEGPIPAKKRRLNAKGSLATTPDGNSTTGRISKGLVESSGPSVESSTDSHPQTPLSPVTTPTGYLRRSVSIEVDDDYERMRIQKEKEREALRQQIEARKKEEARIAAKEAEEKRHHREQEKEIKRHQQEQERMSRQDELLAKQIEEKKRIEDIRREAKEKRSQGMTTVTKPEDKMQLSPPHGEASNVLHIVNLTRPFTQPQLEELLDREGGLVPGKVWTDKRKSHCYSAFYTILAAVSVAERVHGLKWPSHNKRHLEVEYTTASAAFKGSDYQFKAPDPLLGEGEGVQQRSEEPRTAPTQEGLVDKEEVEVEDEVERQQAPREDSISDKSVLKDDKIPQNVPQEERVQKMDEDMSIETSPLDKLFRKTKSTPHIYWLPLTEERIKERNHRKAELERRRVEREKERERSKFSPRTRNRSPRRWR